MPQYEDEQTTTKHTPPHEDLYSIGEVSKLGGISQRALRHYDELGLIEPDRVASNGYRYYSRATMLKIPVINYLKRIGLTLKEISTIFASNDFEAIKKSFHKRLGELDDETTRIIEARTFIDDWDRLIDEANYVLRTCSDEISLKFLPAESFLSMPYDFWGNYADVTINLDFTAFVEEHNNAITGPVILRHESAHECHGHYTQESPCHLRVMQKALRPVSDEHRFDRPGGMYLSTYYTGLFEQMEHAYERLFSYAAEHEHTLCGCSYERFVTDYWTTYDPNLFVVEILIPVER